MTLEQRVAPVLFQAPILINSTSWSNWFEDCERMGVPDFYVARGPIRRAMVEAWNNGDTETQTRLLTEFREANSSFQTQVSTHLSQAKILSKLQGGTVVNLCAGIDFSRLLAHIIGPRGKLFLVDHAPAVIQHLRMSVLSEEYGLNPVVFEALEMSVERIAGREAKKAGLSAGSVDAVMAIRGLHRISPAIRTKALKAAHKALKPEGIVVVVGLFEDDRPKTREPEPGSWFCYVNNYAEALRMPVVYDSGAVIQNQDDMCRLVAFQK